MGNVVPLRRATKIGQDTASSSIAELHAACAAGSHVLILGASQLELIATQRRRVQPADLLKELATVASELLHADVTLPDATERSAALNRRTENLQRAIRTWLAGSDCP